MKFYNFPLCLFSAVWSYPCYCPAYWVLQARELWSGESGDSHWVYNQTDNVTVIVVYWDVFFFFLHILVFILIYHYWWWLKNDDIPISSLLRNGCWPLWRIHSVIRATCVSHDCFCFVSSVHTLQGRMQLDDYNHVQIWWVETACTAKSGEIGWENQDKEKNRASLYPVTVKSHAMSFVFIPQNIVFRVKFN